MLLPLLFEIGRKLVPNREEGVGRDLLLSRLGFDGEGHAQLREPGEGRTAAKRLSATAVETREFIWTLVRLREKRR